MLPWVAWVAAFAAPAAELPSFPGAEGFGANTPGGRGGQVLLVTNLNDAGPGSLRAACEARGARMVVFRVGGLIDLKSPIRIRESFLTIAGQSAPGDGICLRAYGIAIDAHDVVIRYLRIRPGDLAGKEVDGIAIGGTSRSVVVDHCSVSWAVDENLSPSGDIRDVTVQWCIISESLDRSVHHKGAHGYGSLVRATGGVSLHHNLYAHNRGRNPRLGDNYGRPPWPLHDVRNNVIYDFGGPSVAGDSFSANYAGNYLKPGPSTSARRLVFTPTEKARLRFYLKGNLYEGGPEEGAKYFGRTVELVAAPFGAPPVSTLDARTAYARVLDGAGAVLPARDPVDDRVIGNVKSATGKIINSQKDVGGWPEYRTSAPPLDTDLDGMDDSWEKRVGLDPARAEDASLDRDNDGYTNLEEFLNGIRPSGVPVRH